MPLQSNSENRKQTKCSYECQCECMGKNGKEGCIFAVFYNMCNIMVLNKESPILNHEYLQDFQAAYPKKKRVFESTCANRSIGQLN